jgi:peptide deformylase
MVPGCLEEVEVTVRPVLLFGDPRLRTKAVPVDFNASDWREEAHDLLDTLLDLKRRLGFGRGLAAPQIGSRHRLIAFDCTFGRFVAVNPEITWLTAETEAVWDDCFSLPGTCMAVLRHRSASLRCHDLEGREIALEHLDFSLSELVQHEMDHLNGVLMMDRLMHPTAIIAREMVKLVPLQSVSS